jgi:hypothetical protein
MISRILVQVGIHRHFCRIRCRISIIRPITTAHQITDKRPDSADDTDRVLKERDDERGILFPISSSHYLYSFYPISSSLHPFPPPSAQSA